MGLASALAPVFILALSGCGPIEYISQVSNKAAAAVSGAKLAQADHYAPYEYTAAQEYLHKAREEAGYAQYQDAIEYGQKAEDYGNRARAIAVAKMAERPTKSTTVSPANEHEEPGGAQSAPSP
jgi:hypothetical protein